jgi:hypothetical protein
MGVVGQASCVRAFAVSASSRPRISICERGEGMRLGYDFARAGIARLSALLFFARGTASIYQLRAASPVIPPDPPSCR